MIYLAIDQGYFTPANYGISLILLEEAGGQRRNVTLRCPGK